MWYFKYRDPSGVYREQPSSSTNDALQVMRSPIEPDEERSARTLRAHHELSSGRIRAWEPHSEQA